MAHFKSLPAPLTRVDSVVAQGRDSRNMELIVVIRILGIPRECRSSWAEDSFLASQIKIHPSAFNYAR